MKKNYSAAIIFISLINFFFFFIPPVFAKIELSDYPVKIEINKEFTVSVDLTNLSDPVHFLSIVFQKKKGGDYFGQTKNGESWVEAEKANCKSFPQAEIKEGSWSGRLTGRIIFGEKDFDNSLGDYILKVIKYTDSCNTSPSNELPVTLFSTDPPPDTPTITPKPSPRPNNTPHPSSTPKLPKNTSVPTVKVIPSATQSLSALVADTRSIGNSQLSLATDSQKAEVLGEEEIQPTEDKKEKDVSPSTNKQFSLPLLLMLIFGGTVCIGGAVWTSIQKIKKQGKID